MSPTSEPPTPPASPVSPPSPGSGAEERLRDAFARAAYDITPSPLPLAAVRRRGRMVRRRRRVTVLAALTLLSVSGVAAVAALSLPGDLRIGRPVRDAPGGTAAAPPAPPAPTPSAPTPSAGPPLRLVRSGERVAAGGGWQVWLTREGKHWAGPDGLENFRSVTDGNVALSRPGISHQMEGDASGAFHSGLYYGTRAVGRVELRMADGRTISAALLELPGRPGWGVWYAYIPSGRAGSATTALPSLVLYDRGGARLADLPGDPTGG